MPSVSDVIVIEPENGRYTADLLFLHGLWTSSEIWQPVARGLAHRGWRCLLLERAEPAAAETFDEWVPRAEAAMASLSAPPIAIGHDAGGLVALALASRRSVRAAIAVAPLLEGPKGLLPLGRRLLARLRAEPVPPPEAAHPYWRVASETAASRLHAARVPESASLVASLRGPALTPGAPKVATLFVAQRDDAVVSPALVEITARGVEADFRALPGGHWGLIEEGLDPWMTEIHRWMIRRSGASILLLRGDEDLLDE
jgi:pimeloyl-ACP methyl ester carboxylesterase